MVIGEERVENFMQKSQIARAVQKKLELSEKEYKEVLEFILDKIATALIKGEKVTLRNFGTFSIKYRKARPGVNPQNSEPMAIPRKRVVKFNSCKALKKRVNEGK